METKIELLDMVTELVNGQYMSLKDSQKVIKVINRTESVVIENKETEFIFLSESDLKDLNLSYTMKKDNLFKYSENKECYYGLFIVKPYISLYMRNEAILITDLGFDSVDGVLIMNKGFKTLKSKSDLLRFNRINKPLIYKDSETLKRLKNIRANSFPKTMDYEEYLEEKKDSDLKKLETERNKTIERYLKILKISYPFFKRTRGIKGREKARERKARLDLLSMDITSLEVDMRETEKEYLDSVRADHSDEFMSKSSTYEDYENFNYDYYYRLF